LDRDELDEILNGLDNQEEKDRRKGSIVSVTTIETHVEEARERRLDELDELDDAPTERGCLLLAEMSSEGSLLTGNYTEKCVQIAREHKEFVIGFIAQRSLNVEPDDNFIIMTPGVSMPQVGTNRDIKGDGLGQQYNTPRHVVLEMGCDMIIVGRGIIGASDRRKEAERYRWDAWNAYEERIDAD
jgi:uridine monophosphate synthetase